MKYLNLSLFSVLLLSLCLISTSEVKAQASTDSGQPALGIIIGEPTGISFKYWKNNKNAFDLGLAWSFRGGDAVHVHGDYLWHSWMDVDKGQLAFYYGIGARAFFNDNNSVVGARIPIGLNYLFADAPLGAFVEIAPTLDILPDTDFDGSGGIGIRYYF